MPLRRLGEGIGKVVYASPHWVVKRERSSFEVIALINLWKLLRRFQQMLPRTWGASLLSRPSRRIRVLRLLVQGLMLILPKGIWFNSRVKDVWKVYRRRDRRGTRLATEILSGTPLIPKTVRFPPVRVHIDGWPGWLIVSEATERVECTLYERLVALSREGRFDKLELWLNRYLALRQSGWQQGLFSLDAHLKNFGVSGERLVLLDPGGLTDRWEEIVAKLSAEEAAFPPHVQLGLGSILAEVPGIARRFDERWRAVVNPEGVKSHWPG